MTQQCNKCEKIKEIDGFSIESNSHNPNYRRKICKACRTEAANKKRVETDFYKKQYKAMTSEQRSEYIKKKSEQNQRRFKTNPEALAKKKIYDQSDSGVYSRYKGDCNRRNRLKRGIEMRLTLEQFSDIINSPCVYCGTPNSRGADRIDSNKSYTAENSQSCCRHCNEMKNDKTEQQFLEHIQKIIKNRGL